MNQDPQNEHELAEEQAAAAEAGGIGGEGGAPGADPEEQAVREAGGGEQEGFEQAEEQLVEQASHGDPTSPPTHERVTGEVESDRSTAEYGEGDEEDSTAVTRDPAEGPDDPGQGPGLTTER